MDSNLSTQWTSGTFGDPDFDVEDECERHGRRLNLEILCQVFNDKYAVTVEGSRVWIVWFDRDDERRLRFNRVDKKGFYQRWEKRRLTIENDNPDLWGSKKKITKSWAEWWFTWRGRTTFERGVTFDPSGQQQKHLLNLWRGWGVEPTPGDWGLMREHLFGVICGGNTPSFNYLMCWLARMVQRPQHPGEVAVVLRGGKGIGKGRLGAWLVKLAGHHGRHISHSEHLVGRFNAHLRDCIFLFADEAFFAADKRHERTLKQLVTEFRFTVEAKFQDACSARNMLHILIASNDDWVVPASHDERRYFVLDVNGCHQNDRAYFEALEAQMEHGGLAAMLWDLQSMDLSDFDHRRPPGTTGLEQQKKLSFDTTTGWLWTVLDRGYVWESAFGLAEFGQWHERVSNDLLRASYAHYCRKHGKRFQDDPAYLGMFLARFFQSGRLPHGTILREAERDSSRADIVVRSDGRPHGFRLESLAEARQRFATVQKMTLDDLGWGSDVKDA